MEPAEKLIHDMQATERYNDEISRDDYRLVVSRDMFQLIVVGLRSLSYFPRPHGAMNAQLLGYDVDVVKGRPEGYAAFEPKPGRPPFLRRYRLHGRGLRGHVERAIAKKEEEERLASVGRLVSDGPYCDVFEELGPDGRTVLYPVMRRMTLKGESHE